MISVSTFAFALALAVCASGALAWLISSTIEKAAALRLDTIATALSTRAATISRAAENVRTQLAELERHSPKKLAAEVAALSDAVASLGDTHRRFAGKVWQRIGERAEKPNGDATIDDDLQAMLELQSRAPQAQQ